DAGEWLACLAVAVERREVGRHWCWLASLGARASLSPSRALALAWVESARFVPAAVSLLAEWGEAAPALAVLRPEESGAILSALCAELGLPRADTSLEARARVSKHARAKDKASSGAQLSARGVGRDADEEELNEAHDEHEEASARDFEAVRVATWVRRLHSAADDAARLPAPTRQLLIVALAAFRAPALARRRGFAEEVLAFVEGARETASLRGAVSKRPEPRRGEEINTPHGDPARADAAARETVAAREAVATGETADANGKTDAHDETDAHEAVAAHFIHEEERAARPEEVVDAPPQVARDDAEVSAEDESPKLRAEAQSVGREQEEAARRDGVVAGEETGIEEVCETPKPWRGLEGRETWLGGILFLLNLFAHLRLPECFDEDFRLSEQISGWGLAELLARALLGDAAAEYESDPVWEMLARLDGRVAGEPPAAGLAERDSYRAPARWLTRFARGEAVWHARVSGASLVITDARGFVVSERPLGELMADEAAAAELEHFRAQGVSARLSREVDARLRDEIDARLSDEVDARPDAPTSAPVSFERGRLLSFARGRLSQLAGGRLASSGRAPLGAGIRRWAEWALPFLFYALALACAEDFEAAEFEASARSLLLKRGRLFCTATHVDLLMEMSQVSLAARRAGLDASPGWVHDLMRVVSFHFE
ncbi:MAG TPA: hypothetical protein VE713_14785, partial [Pyrinomonadaceae bacterium]|nr:hypothetical protein [Pyrinomonadaceae bacterium]